jgi:hypothetical protein
MAQEILRSLRRPARAKRAAQGFRRQALFQLILMERWLLNIFLA